MKSSPQAELEGEVLRVTFANPENGFSIVRLAAKGHLGEVTAVGPLFDPSPGSILSLYGEWVRHPQYGEQFKVSSFTVKAPVTVEGIRRFLVSGAIPGIGPVMADRIVKAFGGETIEIIEKSPEKLRQVGGIGAARIRQIQEGWQLHSDLKEIMLYLHSHGIGGTFASRIYRTYGRKSIEVLEADPYRLASDVRGIGFRIADRMAKGMGVDDDAPSRIRAGVLYVLTEMGRQGHMYAPRALLMQRSAKVLGTEETKIAEAVASLSKSGRVVIDEKISADLPVYLPDYFDCELSVCRLLAGRCTSGHPSKSFSELPSDAGIQSTALRSFATQLSSPQLEAVRMALGHRLLVITGGPGTGKTTIIRCICDVARRDHQTVYLAAPTGRAAKRMQEATGRSARTIHRMLEIDPKTGSFKHDERNPLHCSLLVIDEMSMVDLFLMERLLRALPADARLVLVGDVDQLPSVGPGSVLRDIIRSDTVPVVRLTEIFRQAARSRIVVNAHRTIRGEMPEVRPAEPDSDFFFVEQNDPAKALEIIKELVRNRIPSRFELDPLSDIQVLAPMHRGVLGTNNLNRALQELLNPHGERVERGNRVLAAGDKVMQTENDYTKGVFNGDLGIIVSVDNRAGSIAVNFDGNHVAYRIDELDEIMPAYAVSIHKSQGSEFPAVVVPLLTEHYVMLRRNLLYTAMTRARKLLVMVGSFRALRLAVRTTESDTRYSLLSERIRQAVRDGRVSDSAVRPGSRR